MQSFADDVMSRCAKPDRGIDGVSPESRRAMASALRDGLRSARRFYVDDEVTCAATTLGVQHPDVLLSMLRRARAPFARCWLEWDNHVQVEAGGGQVDPDGPRRIGVLVERLDELEARYRIRTVAPMSRNEVVGIGPLVIDFSLDEPMITPGNTLPKEQMVLDDANLPLAFVRQSLIGTAYVRLPGMDDTETAFRRAQCDTLAAHAVYSWSPHFRDLDRFARASGGEKRAADIRQTVARDSIIEHAGLWRFVISVLALINARDYVESERTLRQAPGARSVGNKIVPYLDHWLVALKLPRKVVEARLVKEYADAVPRRQHEVIGHWKHSRKRYPPRPGCEHAFVTVAPGREQCALCEHRRWWVNEFQRGDATIGVILKDRVVTTR